MIINNISQDMTALLKYIHDNHMSSELVGIPYFSQFTNDFQKYEFPVILAYQSKVFKLNYVLNFVLSTPSMWMDLSELDWIKIVSSLNPRPDPYKQLIGEADFVDIHFLCKFIRINAIELFLRKQEFSTEDKKRVLKYSKKVVDTLFMDDLDVEDLDGILWVKKHEIDNLRDRLISTGKFQALTCNPSELKEYIEKEMKML